MPPLGTRGLAGSAISLKFKSRNHTSRSRGSILEEMKWGSDRRVGLARALSKMGYCSRSRAFELAREGRVRVNGEARRDPESAVRMEKDRITVDGRAVEVGKRIYLMLNKERGVLTTASDEKGRATVYAYLSDRRPWVAPVGRLDKASEGLLLLTNDSEWAARVLRPEMHLEKTYHVQIGTVAKAALLEALRDGIEVDGQWLRAKRARTAARLVMRKPFVSRVGITVGGGARAVGRRDKPSQSIVRGGQSPARRRGPGEGRKQERRRRDRQGR